MSPSMRTPIAVQAVRLAADFGGQGKRNPLSVRITGKAHMPV